MSKLAHSNEETMRVIERDRLIAYENFMLCENCDGNGAVDAPFSGSDLSCPDCDGLGACEQPYYRIDA